jgi:type II secretory pathway component PulL
MALSPDWLAPLAGILTFIAVLVLAPVMGWLVQGRTRTRRGGAIGAAMEGFGQALQPQQQRLADAKREKNKGGRENGEPPTEQ